MSYMVGPWIPTATLVLYTYMSSPLRKAIGAISVIRYSQDIRSRIHHHPLRHDILNQTVYMSTQVFVRSHILKNSNLQLHYRHVSCRHRSPGTQVSIYLVHAVPGYPRPHVDPLFPFPERKHQKYCHSRRKPRQYPPPHASRYRIPGGTQKTPPACPAISVYS
ncbi:hypothetical protein M426DRAFT_151772 [Hypoxylon sp. CI-4A]|nr:hypothetical protein M426DRAFT_151772 [Hypoxylon sp. CI-4A]